VIVIRRRNPAIPILVIGFAAIWCSLSGSVVAQDDKKSSVADSISDGWSTTNAETVGLAAQKLQEMESAIRADEFKKITSVVIARHGKLAYESYFGGTDASTLMETRSATKSITSMLVGIAIDRGLLASVGYSRLALLSR
jgi:CubicO group peptidase (beta-lactamase class C family)